MNKKKKKFFKKVMNLQYNFLFVILDIFRVHFKFLKKPTFQITKCNNEIKSLEGNKSGKFWGILSNAKNRIIIKRRSYKRNLKQKSIYFLIFTILIYLTVHVPMTLVLGYMRSGSSLTADIIRCNHGDFYIFEPLHGLIELSINRNRPVRFLNGTQIRYRYGCMRFSFSKLTPSFEIM